MVGRWRLRYAERCRSKELPERIARRWLRPTFPLAIPAAHAKAYGRIRWRFAPSASPSAFSSPLHGDRPLPPFGRKAVVVERASDLWALRPVAVR